MSICSGKPGQGGDRFRAELPALRLRGGFLSPFLRWSFESLQFHSTLQVVPAYPVYRESTLRNARTWKETDVSRQVACPPVPWHIQQCLVSLRGRYHARPEYRPVPRRPGLSSRLDRYGRRSLPPEF